IPVRDLFEQRTLADLARKVETVLRTEGAAAAVAIPTLGATERGGPLPLSFAQERLWFLQQMDPGASTYNMPGTIGLSGNLDVAALAQALRAVVDRHEVLRTVFRLIDGEPRQIILPAETRLPVVDLAGLKPEGRLAVAGRLAAEHAKHRFDLARWPLLQAALLRLESGLHHLLVVLHHVICDGWSLHLLMRE